MIFNSKYNSPKYNSPKYNSPKINNSRFKYLVYSSPFLLILLIFLFRKIGKQRNKKFENLKYKGICVFDLDDTLTCGFDNARNAIFECKINECKIAINTARPVPYYKDIKLKRLGLKEEDIKDDVYYGDWTKHLVSFTSMDKILENVAKTKTKHLETLKDKYGIKDSKKIILFDDQIKNIEHAKNAGFSGIHANSVACGLPEDVKKQIRDIMNN